jgi:hypothetical protein
MEKINLIDKVNQVKSLFPDLLAKGVRVNDLLLEVYKYETGQSEFKSFKQWLAEGFKVKKGEHGFPVFSRPKNVINQEKNKDSNQDQNQEPGKGKFFRCYLFHAGQVEPATEKK